MTDVTAERQELEQTCRNAEEVKARQESHTAARQAATQELREILARGNDVAMRLRFAAKVKLGPRNEQRVQFGAAPLRKRSASTAKSKAKSEDRAGARPAGPRRAGRYGGGVAGSR